MDATIGGTGADRIREEEQVAKQRSRRAPFTFRGCSGLTAPCRRAGEIPRQTSRRVNPASDAQPCGRRK